VLSGTGNVNTTGYINAATVNLATTNNGSISVGAGDLLAITQAAADLIVQIIR